MPDSEPLVSVFLPTYNHENYVEESIESALQQEYENLEIVIGDDCSTDSTWDIVSRYAAEYPETITAFRNEENLGITGNCNEVLRRCSGKYVVFHSGDDILRPGKIRSQVEVLESDPDCALCYHDVEVFDSENGETKFYWNSGPEGTPPVEGDTGTLAEQLVIKGTSFLSAQSIMVRREAIPADGYDERVPIASDWLMWIETCATTDGTVRYIDRPMARYRKHSESITESVQHDIDKFVTLAIVESRYPELCDAVRHRRGYMYYRRAVSDILANENERGRHNLLNSVRYSVYSWKWIGWWVYSWLNQVGLGPTNESN
ncbi:glycosyltransferase [Halorussus caseinilyticus]|nr:glycosyltransferase [Halorussus sp. DT72]